MMGCGVTANERNWSESGFHNDYLVPPLIFIVIAETNELRTVSDPAARDLQTLGERFLRVLLQNDFLETD